MCYSCLTCYCLNVLCVVIVCICFVTKNENRQMALMLRALHGYSGGPLWMLHERCVQQDVLFCRMQCPAANILKNLMWICFVWREVYSLAIHELCVFYILFHTSSIIMLSPSRSLSLLLFPSISQVREKRLEEEKSVNWNGLSTARSFSRKNPFTQNIPHIPFALLDKT